MYAAIFETGNLSLSCLMKDWPQYFDVLTKNIGQIYGIVP